MSLSRYFNEFLLLANDERCTDILIPLTQFLFASLLHLFTPARAAKYLLPYNVLIKNEIRNKKGKQHVINKKCRNDFNKFFERAQAELSAFMYFIRSESTAPRASAGT